MPIVYPANFPAPGSMPREYPTNFPAPGWGLGRRPMWGPQNEVSKGDVGKSVRNKRIQKRGLAGAPWRLDLLWLPFLLSREEKEVRDRRPPPKEAPHDAGDVLWGRMLVRPYEGTPL